MNMLFVLTNPLDITLSHDDITIQGPSFLFRFFFMAGSFGDQGLPADYWPNIQMPEDRYQHFQLVSGWFVVSTIII